MSVRGHLIRLVLSVVMPLALLTVVFVSQLIENARDSVQSSMRDVAGTLSLAVDTEVQRTITALEVLSLSDSLTAGDIPAFRGLAESTLKVHGRWSNFALNLPDGTRVFNLRLPPAGPVPPTHDVSWVLDAARRRAPAISNVLTSTTSGKPMFYVTVPVLRNGEVKYLMSATMEYDLWTDWLKRQTPQGWIAAIDDREGRIFARSERPEAFTGKPASGQILQAYRKASDGLTKNRNLEGLEIYAAYQTSQFSGWHAIVIVPARLVDAPTNLRIAFLVAGTLVALLLAILLAFVAARPAVSGIARLRDAIGGLGRGQRVSFRRTDITEIDEVGASAQQAGELLQARAESVALLQRQLAERAEVAEQASRMKDQFLGMLGHELRNPLAAISNATAVLLMQPQGSMREMHEIIQRQTRQLTALVDDLLDVSRAAAGKMQVRPQALDLGETVLRVKASLDAAGALDQHDVRLDVARAPVNGDPERIAQIVRNLLENAAKYTPAGGTIDVRVRVEGSNAVLKVRDNGCGIPPALLPRVFDPFVQAPQPIDRSKGGLGLGLAIVRQVVALHDGSVEAHSEGEGRGAEFVVRIPVLVDGAGNREEAAPVELPRRTLRVALIEDHEDSRLSLGALLRSEGHRVHEAADGLLGLVLLQHDAFDVAFVDIGLPGIDGYELVRRARAAGVTCRFVALTGYGQAADRERAALGGFDSFLVKPASADQVRAALASVHPVSPRG